MSYWKHKKYPEMVSNHGCIPSSYKHGLTLQALQEVKESEDYITLCVHLEVGISQSQRNLASFALRVYAMNRVAHQRQYKITFYKLLPTAARIFLAQYGVESYGTHQVIMNLLAMHSDADEILSPLNTTPINVLVIYREANELAILSFPTVLNNIYEVIDPVNGPHPGEDPPPTAAAAAATSAPSTSSATSNQATENQVVIRSEAYEFQAQSSPAVTT